jgi:hypothetical protein
MIEILRQVPQLEVHEVPDGYIVYQAQKDKVCYLNKTAALVFELCDGHRGDSDVIDRVTKIYDLTRSGQDEIKTCIDSLVKEGLVESSSR